MDGLVYAICELRTTFLHYSGPDDGSVQQFMAKNPRDPMTIQYQNRMRFGSGSQPWVAPVVNLTTTPLTPPGPPPVVVPPVVVPPVVVPARQKGQSWETLRSMVAAVPINPGLGTMMPASPKRLETAPLYPPTPANSSLQANVSTLQIQMDTNYDCLDILVADVKNLYLRLPRAPNAAS